MAGCHPQSKKGGRNDSGQTLPGVPSCVLLPWCLLTHTSYCACTLHTHRYAHTPNWISNGAKCFRPTNKYFQMQIPSLPPGPPHNCSLSSWRQSRVGRGCAAKINPIFCSFSVLGCNPLPSPLPLHRWGISWASGSALSRGEGDGQGRD